MRGSTRKYPWALLFLCYVNDMVTSIDADCFLYADDSAILLAHKGVVIYLKN